MAKTHLERTLPAVRNLLKNNKTVWGFMALSTKEICRAINGNKPRAYCHYIFKSQDNLTAGSWSKNRGCMYVKREEIAKFCPFWYQDVKRALWRLVENGEVETWKGTAPDLKNMGRYVCVSRDLYRFWAFKKNAAKIECGIRNEGGQV